MHRILTSLAVVFVLLFAAALAAAAELESRYTTIVYEREDLLRQLNDEVRLRSLSYLMRNRTSLTVAEEVGNKVDVVLERVEKILEMFPRDLKFRIVLLASDREVAKAYKRLYARNVDFISFYSPRDKTVYLSVSDVNLHVLAHELAHVVVDHYFGISPSATIHELLAQFAESHLED
jgi:small-conductance mechanosensitive channel